MHLLWKIIMSIQMKSSWDVQIMKVMLIWLYCKGSPAESTTEVLVGMDVTLNCMFNKMSKSDNIHLSDINVEWMMVDKDSKKHKVYMFEDETPQVYRVGSGVDKMGLLQDNASLHLHNVTVGDQGVYDCRVIITPNIYTETIELDVSARPSVSLPETVTVKEGDQKTLLCDITGFYPEKLEVNWLIQNGSQEAHISHTLHVCTGVAVLNTDGTYSVSSGITVQATAVGSGEAVYICQVRHRSYPGPYRKKVTLTVQAIMPLSPEYNAAKLMAMTSVISVILVVSVIGGVLVLYRYFHKDPPSVSDIMKPDIIYAMKPTDLKCIIKGIRQRELKVKWFRTTEDITWASNSQLETDPILFNEDLSDQATIHSEKMHHVSTLSVCLTVNEEQAKYQCVVLYRGNKVTRETTVKVKVNPSFLQISSTPQIPKVERLLVLCCWVEKFYPGDVHLEWSRNDGEQVMMVSNYGPFSDHDCLYSVSSKVELTMAKEDEQAIYTCRVYHSSFPLPGYKDLLYHINTHGTPPNVMFIKCDPQHPLLGKECTFNLCVKDFCPEEVSVTWSKNGQVLTDVFNSPPSLSINGLYSMRSFLKLTLNREDDGSELRCRVVHCAQRELEERVFTLSELKAT